MLGLIILGVGWFWARSVIWYIQRQESFEAIGSASRGEDYQFWGLTVPRNVAAGCFLAYLLGLASACTPRRRRGLLLIVAAYAVALSPSHFLLFAFLYFEAFLPESALSAISFGCERDPFELQGDGVRAEVLRRSRL
jgi:hypothetical protein